MLPALSVLDQSPVASGRTAADALAETLALARRCDALGYARYWLAEHHNSEALACSAPEVMIAAVAATTRRIRVGSAGVMLPHYSPLKVAEVFRALEGIAPGRIDLGLGRAPGSDGRTAHALNPDAANAAERFPVSVSELLAWLRVGGRALPEGHPFREVRAVPEVATAPQVWILGSSDYGAQVAAHFGLPYCFAHFITDGRGAAEALSLYRDLFRPGALGAPRAAVAVFALAADTEAEAWRAYSSRALWRLSRDRGVFPPLPSAAEAEAYPYSAAERAHLDRLARTAVVGTGARVVERLAAVARDLGGVEEVAVLTAAHDPAARVRSYEAIAEAAGLPGAGAGPTAVALAAE